MKPKKPQTVQMVCLRTGEVRDVAGKPPAGFRPLDEVSEEELAAAIRLQVMLLRDGFETIAKSGALSLAGILQLGKKGTGKLTVSEPVPIEGLPKGVEGISLTATLSAKPGKKLPARTRGKKGGPWVTSIVLQKPVQKARVVLKRPAARKAKPACH